MSNAAELIDTAIRSLQSLADTFSSNGSTTPQHTVTNGNQETPSTTTSSTVNFFNTTSPPARFSSPAPTPTLPRPTPPRPTPPRLVTPFGPQPVGFVGSYPGLNGITPGITLFASVFCTRKSNFLTKDVLGHKLTPFTN